MSHLQTRRLVLSLALAVLWPATAFAQTPGALPPRAAPPQVQIKVEFATVSAADLDKSGVTFDRVPLAQPGAFLQYATDDTAIWLLRTLIHARGKIVQAPLITTNTNTSATIQVTTQAPDGKGGFLSILSGLTIRPRVNSDDSISLSIALPAASTGAPAAEPPATNLRTIRSGDVIAVAGLPFGFDRASSDQKLLIFVTPTIVGTDAQKADTGLPIGSLPGNSICHVPHERRFSIDVANADLHAIIAMMEQQANMKASVQDSGKPYSPVFVHINAALLPEALQAIARSAGAQIIRDENGVYVFSPLPGAARRPVPEAGDAHPGRSVTVTP